MMKAAQDSLHREGARIWQQFVTEAARLAEAIEPQKGGWIPLAINPTKSRRYLVGHRGYQVTMHFLADDFEHHPGAKLGWQGNLDFGPTHWLEFQDLE